MTDSSTEGLSPAFPVTAGSMVYSTGMTRRDWFAGQALAGIASQSDADGETTWRSADAARWAYQLADAMIAEGAKP